jgi:phosphoenolpyruvate carboxykinase (ATP)
MEFKERVPDYGVEYLGLHSLNEVHWNLTTPALYEFAIRRYEAQLAHHGPLVVSMGQHTGRAAKDKYIVDEPVTRDDIWWGKVNVSYPEDRFEGLFKRMLAYLRGKTIYIQDCYAGADPESRYPVRVITTFAWHSIFVRNMFILPPDDNTAIRNFVPEFTVLHCPNFHADSDDDGTRSGTFVAINLSRKLILIGGTAYAGEIKKSIFSALNFFLPGKKILPMHCSANVNANDPGDVAIFFGLSGTGKTTLSADPNRVLIGDDEHGWSDKGIFNFEGGCYAKVINLSKEAEPEIYATTRRFGTILENVSIDPVTKKLDLDDDSLTENTRASYPLSHLPNYVKSGMAGHPRSIIMLTADAFGIMPPVARLSTEQAMYHFISGYTAKVAGTEKGVTEPVATFSACFGAPFMMRHPLVYAQLLEEKIQSHNSTCWLVNTGWTGGPYGTGKRMAIQYTRALLNAALDGILNDVEMYKDPIFGFQVPVSVPGVPAEVLNPRNTWSDKGAYDVQAQKLARLFEENFAQFTENAPAHVREAGPRVA